MQIRVPNACDNRLGIDKGFRSGFLPEHILYPTFQNLGGHHAYRRHRLDRLVLLQQSLHMLPRYCFGRTVLRQQLYCSAFDVVSLLYYRLRGRLHPIGNANTHGIEASSALATKTSHSADLSNGYIVSVRAHQRMYNPS